MDETLVTIALLMMVFGWRFISSFQTVQHCLHKGPTCMVVLQWYSLLFVGLGLLLVRTFWDVVRFEYFKYHFLEKDSLEDDRGFIPNISEDERKDMAMPPWLRICSLIAPACGVVAGLVVMQHVAMLVRASAERSRNRGIKKNRLWHMSKEMNCVLLVVAMPIVFIVMAMRAEIRVWAVMTGSAWLPYHKMEPNPTRTWEEVKLLELGAYRTALELANFFQYLTIWNFGRLCISHLRNAPDEYRFTLRFAGLQGVYLYVIVGGLRSIGLFAEAIAETSPAYKVESTIIQEKVLSFIAPIFVVATLQCIYNMLIIGSMQTIRDTLGSVNIKFQATRALLLISQIQLSVLNMLTVDADGNLMNEAAAAHQDKIPEKVLHVIRVMNFSPVRAKLLHAALLNFECLFVVVFNRVVWTKKWDYEHREESLEERPQKPLSVPEGKLTESLLA